MEFINETHIAEMFWRAAYGQVSWEQAIDALALPLGARTGQIASVSPDLGIQFSLLSRVSESDMADFLSHNAHLPSINPRINRTLRSPVGICIDDNDFIDRDTKDRMDIFRRFFDPTGTSNALIVKLQTRFDTSCAYAFSLLRPEGMKATEGERRLVERLVPAISGAVETAMIFGRFEVDAMIAALHGSGKPSIALGLGRRVIATSEDAEHLLAHGSYFSLKGGRLQAVNAQTDSHLAAAFTSMTASGALDRGRRFFAVRSAHDDRPPIVATLNPVASRGSGPLSPVIAFLTVAGGSIPSELAAAFGEVFALTAAETAIAISIANGLDSAAIARIRGVSLATVRTQLKSVLMKTGAHRQSELASLVISLMG